MVYAQAAPIYRARGLWSIPVRGKRPVPTGCTGDAGVVTDEKIAAWIADPDWSQQNVALRADGWIGIDVDVYGDKHGDEYVAELEKSLGGLPATITSTARGIDSPSRQHFYRVPRGLAFMTKLGDAVEIIQWRHRYAVVAPSTNPDSETQYQWYGYEGELLAEPPSLDDFEDLPGAWLEYLSVAPNDSHSGFNGSIDAWLQSLPEGSPDPKVRAVIESIPTEFGHDEMVKLAFRIVRLGAERHPGVEDALTALQQAWTRPPWDDADTAAALITAVAGAIAKAGAPEEPAPNLVPMQSISFPALTSVGKDFMQMVIEDTEVATAPERANRRHEILREGYIAGLGDAEVLSLAWGSVAGQEIQSQPGGLETLWREAQIVRKALDIAPAVKAIPENAVTTYRPDRIELLDDAERASIAGDNWWGNRYTEWASTRVPVYNGPYHRMNRWIILSLVFGNQGFAARKGRPMGVNLYCFTGGESSTGKTEAWDIAEQVIDAYFTREDSPFVGKIDKMSPNGLHEALLYRDGQVSLIRSDEAQGLLRQLRDSKWQDGILPDIADYYEGRVNPMQMKSNKELSGVTATTSLVTALTGITSEMTDALELSQWTSGVLYRFVFCIGDPPQVTDGMFDEEDSDEYEAGTFDLMPRQWAAEFRAAGSKNAAIGHRRPLRYEDDARRRHTQFKRQLHEALHNHPRYTAVLSRANIRFANSIRKAATLVALSEASELVTLRHELIALEQAEEWLAAMLTVLDMTSESKFDREVEEVREYIAAKPTGQTGEAEIFRVFKPAERAERILRQLATEERVTRDRDSNGASRVTLVRG